MVDIEDVFSKMPLVKKLIDNPIDSSRKVEEIFSNLANTGGIKTSDQMGISEDQISHLISDAILSNQPDYSEIGYQMGDLGDTLENISMGVQDGIYGILDSMDGVQRQLKIKNSLNRRKLDQDRIGLQQNEEKNQRLENIDFGVDQIGSALENIGSGIYDQFMETRDLLEQMTASNAEGLQIGYGIPFADKKKIKEILPNNSFESKQTLLALYAKDLLDSNGIWEQPLDEIFSENFRDYLRKNISSEQAFSICTQKRERLQVLEKEYKQQYDILLSQKLPRHSIDEELAGLGEEIKEARKGRLSDEEIVFLDIYQAAKQANSIVDLINMGFLDDHSLETLIRHQKLDGNTSLEVARIMKVDRNGVTPKVDLDGDVGRWQQLKAQTIQGNIALGQRQSIIEGISEGNELTQITNQILTDIQYELSDVLNDIGDVLIAGFESTIEELQEIKQGTYNITEELKNINNSLLMPLEIRANEFYKYGEYRIHLNEPQSAFENFQKGLNEKNTHLGNLYGAGVAKKMMGQDKEAEKYFIKAYKVSHHEGNKKLSSSIALDIAKINIKYLRLKIAKKWLSDSINSNELNTESIFLKTRIVKILGDGKEFSVLLQYIYDNFINGNRIIDIKGNYSDIFKHFYKHINILINEERAYGGTSKLIKVLPKVEKIGYEEGVEKIIEHVLFINPISLKDDINLQNIIAKNKAVFNVKYREFAIRESIGGKSQDFFMIAYIGYQYIDFKLIREIIRKGLECDIDYIGLVQSSSLEQKKMHRGKIKEKLYALGENGKYMFRDYLESTPNSLFNI